VGNPHTNPEGDEKVGIFKGERDYEKKKGREKMVEKEGQKEAKTAVQRLSKLTRETSVKEECADAQDRPRKGSLCGDPALGKKKVLFHLGGNPWAERGKIQEGDIIHL